VRRHLGVTFEGATEEDTRALPADTADSAGARAYVDTTGKAHRSYGARNGTLVLVRPDGYVGLIDHDPGPDTLRDHLGCR
jgi:hypothetical protein